MLSCKDMTKLISDSLDRKITLRQRMELWLHIMMCGMCRRFRSFVLALRRRIRAQDFNQEPNRISGSAPAAAETLSSSAKERISVALKRLLG